MPDSVQVKVWGEFALFARPELKVERLSYPIMTPSAARGVLDAILFRPQMCWHIRRITALRPEFPGDFPASSAELPYRLIGVRRNEIQGTIAPRTVSGWMQDPSEYEPYLVDSAGREGRQGANRTQRHSMALHHVAYLITATPRLTSRANQPRKRPEDEEDTGPDTVTKYVAMFNRRVSRGQCFHRPYLGCREFAAHFAPANPADRPLLDWNENLGRMLYDLDYQNGQNVAGFFDAEVKAGVLHCDRLAPGLNQEPPVRVLGWAAEGSVP